MQGEGWPQQFGEDVRQTLYELREHYGQCLEKVQGSIPNSIATKPLLARLRIRLFELMGVTSPKR